VALATEVRTQEKTVTAYVVARDSATGLVAELRRFLGSRVPEYMIPASFVFLSSLPLTPNGKVNRRALPPPGDDSTEQVYIPPGTEAEQKMAGIWRQFLQRQRIGLQQDFFELGGHSLLAAQLINQVNTAFQSKLKVVDLFTHRTVEQLSQLIALGNPASERPVLVPAHESPRSEPVFLISRNVSLEILRKLGIGTGHPVFTTEVPSRPDVLAAAARYKSELYPTISEMAAPHTSLVREGLRGRSCSLAGYSYGGILAFETARLLERDGILVKAVVIFDQEIRPPASERFKQKINRHARNAIAQGWGYLWRRAQQARQRMKRGRETVTQAQESPDVSPEWLAGQEFETTWPLVVRVWDHSLDRYHPTPVRARGIVIRARDQKPGFTSEENYDGCLGWKRLFRGGCQMVDVPGDHASMWKQPHLGELLKAWEKCFLL
jgi:thioesterase domain-containing protein